jgi:hypothetical protein
MKDSDENSLLPCVYAAGGKRGYVAEFEGLIWTVWYIIQSGMSVPTNNCSEGV